jgi:predicted phage tail protein
VEHVVLAQSASCITAPPAYALQTEEGAPSGSLTSKAGYCVGNIRITTDGQNLFTVSADGGVHQGPNELGASSLPQSFTLDNVGPTPDTTAPATSVTAPANGATVSGTVSVTASATDNVGVTSVEFYLDGALQSTDTTAPYSWSWNTTGATNGGHSLMTKAYDAAGNAGSSAAVSVTVANGGADTTAPTAPTSLTASTSKRKINLTWGASTDNVGVTGYRVWRSSSAAGPFSQIGTTTSTSYTNSGLTSGSTWYYYVTATDAAGNVSAPSNTASATAR